MPGMLPIGIATCAILAAQVASVEMRWSGSELAILAHHGADQAPAVAKDTVEQFIATSRSACFERGAQQRELKALAENQHWNSVSGDELARHATTVSEMIGGWTFETSLGAVAVMQSRLRAPMAGYVCSVTSKIASASEHLRAKGLVGSAFGVDIAAESDKPGQHTDRYWIERGQAPPVKASLVYDRTKGMITMRMVHGDGRPQGT